MRSGLFFLSVGLLALGANLPGMSGQKDTEKPALEKPVTLTCLGEGLPPDSSLRWFHNDEAVPTSVNSTSSPLQKTETPEDPSLSSTVRIRQEDLQAGDVFTCLVKPKVFPPLTGQKTRDKDSGIPLASDRTTFRPHFQGEESYLQVVLICMIKGFYPVNLSISWEENGRPLPEGNYTIESIQMAGDVVHNTLTIGGNIDSLQEELFSCTIRQRGGNILSQKSREKA